MALSGLLSFGGDGFRQRSSMPMQAVQRSHARVGLAMQAEQQAISDFRSTFETGLLAPPLRYVTGMMTPTQAMDAPFAQVERPVELARNRLGGSRDTGFSWAGIHPEYPSSERIIRPKDMGYDFN
jgi:hypothetical protein